MRRDGSGLPEEVRQEYGNAPNIRVLPDPQWRPESILASLDFKQL